MSVSGDARRALANLFIDKGIGVLKAKSAVFIKKMQHLFYVTFIETSFY